MTSKYLYIPMELVVRELDGKALVAAAAKKSGWTTILGWKRAILEHMNSLPEGVFLVKSATPNEFQQITNLRNAGHRVCVLDEEGLVDQIDSFESQLRYNNDTLALIDKMYLWGEAQYRAFNNALPDFRHKAVLSGNPRSDFWARHAASIYQPEIKELQERYGNFIFMPSSFGGAVHRMGGNYGVDLTFEMGQGSISDHMAKLLRAQGELLRINFNEHYEFLPVLANTYPNTNIVIRPHPSEAHEPWQNLADNIPNIHVAYEGAVTPWILASKVMMHFRSTTSAEAYLMGKTVTTYTPPLPEYLNIADLEIPEAVSLKATSRKDMIDLIGRLLAGEDIPLPPENQRILQAWIYEEEQKSAADIIVEEMESICPTPTRDLRNITQDKRKKLSRKLGAALYDIMQSPALERLMPEKLKYRALAEEYGQHKEIGLNEELVRRIVQDITDSKDAKSVWEVSQGMIGIQ